MNWRTVVLSPIFPLSPRLLKKWFSQLSANNLYNHFQSAYRPGHSTETTFLKIVSDLLLDLDDGNVSLLALLDLSAAFDMIDHSILLHWLHHEFQNIRHGPRLVFILPYKPHSVCQRLLLHIQASSHLFRCSTGISPWTCPFRSLYSSSFDFNWKALRPSSLISWRLSTPNVCTPSSNPWPLPLLCRNVLMTLNPGWHETNLN